ncbi:MAG: site-specific DNA-methyltransferase [Chloroflexi bacterium]|nr:site-specific DNA-methyltransferase [Chloroflexota bacterium]MDL1882977.1 site-specific DNA-methyltransferase [Anaerolineae bacterium CFX8]
METLIDTVLIGDSWTQAQNLPSECVQCIITSPPYWGHRQYAKAAELREFEFGSEKTAQKYVEKLVALFDELKRVLKPNGTLWLNLGDTYRDGQLAGIPWRTALALKDTGWLLRSEIIWHKPNAMPSSVTNRPTTDHETIFLFAKSPNYYYNADAIREPHVTFSEQSRMKGGRKHLGKINGTPEKGKNQGNSNLHRGRWDQAFHPLGRNKRTVWNIPLSKFRDAHFAVFPPQLVETCLLAGTTRDDLVLDPFMGSGTTAVVAKEHGRHFVGLELVPEYAEMTLRRVDEIQIRLI